MVNSQVSHLVKFVQRALSEVKCVNVLQFHSVKEPSYNRHIWVLVLFGSLRGMVRFGFLHIFTFRFGFGLVLGKTWVLVQIVLAWFGFFLVCSKNAFVVSQPSTAREMVMAVQKMEKDVEAKRRKLNVSSFDEKSPKYLKQLKGLSSSFGVYIVHCRGRDPCMVSSLPTFGYSASLLTVLVSIHRGRGAPFHLAASALWCWS